MRAACRAFSPFSAFRRTPVLSLGFPRNDGVGSSSLPVGFFRARPVRMGAVPGSLP